MSTANTVQVVITWAPKTAASLVVWIDDDELISPVPKSVFEGRGRVEFEYEGNNDDEFHILEWILLFPEKKLHDLVAKVSWDGKTWHTAGAHPGDAEHRWTAFGVAP